MVAATAALTIKNEVDPRATEVCTASVPASGHGADGDASGDNRTAVRTEMRLQASDLLEYRLGPLVRPTPFPPSAPLP